MKRARRLRRLLLVLAGLLAALLFLLYSETGLRLGIYLLTDLIVKPLTINEVHGRLAGPLSLQGIGYDDSLRRLSLEQLKLDWKPSNLFTATAHITELHAQGLDFHPLQAPSEEPEGSGEKFTLPQIGFPLKLIIDDARLDKTTLRFSPEGEPLQITQISLQAETSLNTLQLHALRMESDWLKFTIKGNIRPRQDYQTALTLDWTLPQQGRSPWEGSGTLEGNVSHLRLHQKLASPFPATLTLEGEDLLDTLSWNGRVEIPKLQSSQLPFSISPAFSLETVLTASGDIDSFKTSSRFAGKIETIGTVQGNLEASYFNRQIQLTTLLIDRKDDDARIEASGNLEFTTPLRYRLKADWQRLSWPLDSGTFVSEDGELTIRGQGKQYQFNGDFQLSGAQVPSGQWQLQGEGDDTSVALAALEGRLLDGTISGNATANFGPQLKWQGKLQGISLNPGKMWPQWPGAIAFTANFNGGQSESGLAMEISIPSLGGTLRGRKLQGHSEVTLRGSTGSLKDFEVQIGSANVRAKGELADKLAFDWQLEAAELADLWPQVNGSLTADGSINGPLKTPKIVLQAEGKRLRYGAYQAGQLQADINLDLQPQSPSALDVQIGQLLLPGFPQQSLSLEGRGPLGDHIIHLKSGSSNQSLTMNLAAGYSNGRWAGILNKLQIEDEKLGQWQLAQATEFSVAAETMKLDEVCLNQAAANLCGQGSKLNSQINAVLRSSGFPLELLQPYLPQRFVITGKLDGTASLGLAPNRPPRLAADLMINEGQFSLINPVSGYTDISLPYRRTTIRLNTSPAGVVESELTLLLAEQDQVVLSVQSSIKRGFPEHPLQHPITARLTASIEDLEFISSLVPEVQNFHGKLNTDVLFAGTLQSPRLSGYAKLEEGRLDIPRLGLKISAIRLAASGDNSMKMDISGSARSGEGSLELSGQLAPTQSGMWGLKLAMNGKNFEVARIPEARMQLSPDLTASIIGRQIRLEGEIDIPSARLEPPDINLAVKPSEDVIIIEDKTEEIERERWLIYTRIRMTAADSIRFIGYGFDGRIGGDLLLIDEPGTVTRARGQLRVTPGSTYKIFGTKLSTERGQLNFADSPVDNPNLDIRATRTIGEVIAGVNVTGTAQRPVLSLFSEPPMDQADILSYLTLGHPMRTAGQSEGTALAGAADTAGLIGGNYLAGVIGRQFGLEEARVEADPTTQSPWVVMGTYLSPRLYVRYGVGVYEDAYSIIVRYQLSEHWQVQGEGGRNSGADIFYTFERP